MIISRLFHNIFTVNSKLTLLTESTVYVFSWNAFLSFISTLVIVAHFWGKGIENTAAWNVTSEFLVWVPEGNWNSPGSSVKDSLVFILFSTQHLSAAILYCWETWFWEALRTGEGGNSCALIGTCHGLRFCVVLWVNYKMLSFGCKSCITLCSFPLPSTCRKSYEFEDLLQSSSENGRVDWYAQTKLALTRTLSEENVYEDILGRSFGQGGIWLRALNNTEDLWSTAPRWWCWLKFVCYPHAKQIYADHSLHNLMA